MQSAGNIYIDVKSEQITHVIVRPISHETRSIHLQRSDQWSRTIYTMEISGLLGQVTMAADHNHFLEKRIVLLLEVTENGRNAEFYFTIQHRSTSLLVYLKEPLSLKS